MVVCFISSTFVQLFGNGRFFYKYKSAAQGGKFGWLGRDDWLVCLKVFYGSREVPDDGQFSRSFCHWLVWNLFCAL